MTIRFLVLWVLLVFASAAQAQQMGNAVVAQALAVKSDRVVLFYDDQNNEILRVHAVFGQVKGPKTKEGDSKTPEGDYILSPARPSREWDWFMPIDYPNAADIARAKAAGQPLQTLGKHIGMHSVGDGFMRNVRQSFNENWTLGCIAIHARDMDRVRSLMTTPIPIRIEP